MPVLFQPVPAGPPDRSDVFCADGCPENFQQLNILAETDHFRLTTTPYPKSPGQLIIVPKPHIATFADVPLAWHRELRDLIAKAMRFHTEMYGAETCLREQGSHERQSVHHAHLHLLPVREPVTLPGGLGVRSARDWRDVARFRLHRGDYYYIQFREKRRIMHHRSDAVIVAERALCEAISGRWDSEKREPAGDTSPAGRIALADLVDRWRAWECAQRKAPPTVTSGAGGRQPNAAMTSPDPGSGAGREISA